MCGIFGIISSTPEVVTMETAKQFKKMMVRSERRGKDASGILLVNEDFVYLEKSNKRGKKLAKSRTFAQIHRQSILSVNKSNFQILAGHTRMSTHGKSNYENTQPIVGVDARFFLFHNGIAINWKDLQTRTPLEFEDNPSDSTVILKHFEYQLITNQSVSSAFAKTCELLSGSNNLVLLDSVLNVVHFYTNNGSLFYSNSDGKFIFGSDQGIVRAGAGINADVQQFLLGQVIEIKLKSDQKAKKSIESPWKKPFIESKISYDPRVNASQGNSLKVCDQDINESLRDSIDFEAISRVKRCTKCVIPETYPGIEFNENNLCSLCVNYDQHSLLGAEMLLEKIRDSGSRVLVPLSGGRDSGYALDYLAKYPDIELVAYTYDWGFVTNLARENVSKICGELKVEHILEAADLSVKRKNVTKNLKAWLKKPDIGLIPILMAGDKEFLTKAEIVRSENDLGISVFAMNQYERTGFKSGFAGVTQSYDKKRFHGLSFPGRLRLLAYYGAGVMRNPRYLNTSLWDSLVGFFSFYTVDTNYIQIFDYIGWDENKIETLLINKYQWSNSNNGTSLWRTGDATAAFYNYLYLRYAGFSEFDTFRSNQVRAGALTREKALELCSSENLVRVQEICDYLASVNISVREVMENLKDWGRFSK